VVNQPYTNFSRVADGVIHFRLQSYDARGFPLAWYFLTPTKRYAGVQLKRDSDPALPAESIVACLSNTVPAYVEIELGILEPQALEQYRSFAAGSVFARRFLSNHVGQVHLFRQRVPVRQSDRLVPLP